MKPSFLKVIFYSLSLFLILHFITVTISLTSNYIGYSEKIKETAYQWVYPFFEQNWGMFSNPPTADDYCLIRFKYSKGSNTINSNWLNITYPLSERGIFLFSIDQRLAKYMSGIISNIHTVQRNGIIDSKHIKNLDIRNEAIKNRLLKCSGFQSMILYSRHVFEGQKLGDIDKNEVMVQIRIVHEVFPKYDQRNIDFLNMSNRRQRSLDFGFQKLF